MNAFLRSPGGPLLSRRAALLGLSAAWTMGRVSLAMANAPTTRRFVVVLLRGAMDGMSAIVPYGDRDLASLRPELIPGAVGSQGGMLDLGGFYGLNPALAGLHDMYAAGELLPVHAIAGHYRSRSHFEAQDYMESGADHRMDSGWLNRVAMVVPSAHANGDALAVGLSMPLLLRGPATVGSWAPPSGSHPPPDLYARIAQLNAPDAIIGPALTEALRERGFTSDALAHAAPTGVPAAPPDQAARLAARRDGDATGPGPAMDADGHAGDANDRAPKPNAFSSLARTCGTLMAAPAGPRIAALEVGGWDTHGAQQSRLRQPLHELADGLVGLKEGLGDAWASTAVLVITEFGRTARMNGTAGTDHGTGAVAFALGGSIRGGRVMANWPGLSSGNLLENRDLQPTADLRSLAKGLLAQHMGIGPAGLAQVFPDSDGAAPMQGLFRTA